MDTREQAAPSKKYWPVVDEVTWHASRDRQKSTSQTYKERTGIKAACPVPSPILQQRAATVLPFL